MSEIIINGDCWVAYFDILGFKRKVQIAEQSQSNWILKEYEEVLNKAGLFRPCVDDVLWFSDSFVFYSENSTESIVVAAEWFFDFMFRAKIALRGCLNYGRFYADRVKRIYYGTGLIEAYELAESQDWIGFVLSEKAQNRMSECRTKTNRTCWDACKSHYIEYDVPLSTKGAYHNKRRLPAYKICFHSGEPESMRSDDYFRFVLMLDSSRYEIEHGPGLSEQDRAELRAGVRRKYENTDRFLSKVYPEIDQNLHNQFRDSLYY